MADETIELTEVQAVLDGLSSPTDEQFVQAVREYSDGAIASAAALLAMAGGGGGGGSLPDWWTVDSTPGSESVEFAGAVEIEPGRDVSALVLRGFAGQTEHILRVYNEVGDLAMNIDANGRVDLTQFVVQVPPDTGGAGGISGSSIGPGSWLINSGTDAVTNALQVSRWDVPFLVWGDVFAIGNTGSIIRTSPTTVSTNETAIEMVASQDTTGNAIELWDYPFNNLLFSVSYTGGIQATLPTANPGPGILWNDGGTVKVGT